jgi:hypothetical protein
MRALPLLICFPILYIYKHRHEKQTENQTSKSKAKRVRRSPGCLGLVWFSAGQLIEQAALLGDRSSLDTYSNDFPSLPQIPSLYLYRGDFPQKTC